MRKHYSDALKLFVVQSRRDGSDWKSIKQDIKTTFRIEPPTIRAMQNWEKDIIPEALRLRVAKDEAQAVRVTQQTTVLEVANSILPLLSQASNVGGEIEYMGWQFFFQLVETLLGTEKFDKFLERYRESRESVRGE